jgi:hypothetical protein
LVRGEEVAAEELGHGGGAEAEGGASEEVAAGDVEMWVHG